MISSFNGYPQSPSRSFDDQGIATESEFYIVKSVRYVGLCVSISVYGPVMDYCDPMYDAKQLFR